MDKWWEELEFLIVVTLERVIICGTYNCDHNLLNHFQKAQDNQSVSTSTCIGSLSFPECLFHGFAWT